MLQRNQIRVRDPYVVLKDSTYYLYATTGDTTHSYYTSDDLINWKLGGTSFEIPEDFWAYKDVWAGEIHTYQEKYYLFVTLLGKNGLRGTQVCVSDTPEGPFIPITDRAVTPKELSCIDGTLCVDNGTPYIVYSHDWPDNYIEDRGVYMGQICAAELTADLKEIKGEPWVIFNSDEVPLSKATPHHCEWEGKPVIRYGSDGPFLYRFADGTLIMLWSPYLQDHYVVLGAVSESGSVKGPWRHMEKPVFDRDGGHAMIFHDKDGRMLLSLHQPERYLDERAHFFTLEWKDGQLTAVDEI